jgi:hypothetical protein
LLRDLAACMGWNELDYWHNQIWQIMVKQSLRGLTPEQAANEIYMVYGVKTSVTKE